VECLVALATSMLVLARDMGVWSAQAVRCARVAFRLNDRLLCRYCYLLLAYVSGVCVGVGDWDERHSFRVLVCAFEVVCFFVLYVGHLFVT